MPPFADMPTLAVNIETPSAAPFFGYLVFDDATYGKFNTAKVGPTLVAVDRSSDVRTLRTARGAGDSTDALFHAQAGTCTATLDNRGRLFDPTNTADVRPKRVVQVQATWNSITYTLFYGTIGSWQMEYPGRSSRSDAITSINAVDATKYLVDLNIAELFPRETTGQRVTRILDMAGWSQANRSIASGQTVMPSTSGGTVSGWQAAQEAADSELGEIYVSGSGVVTFRDRMNLITDSRSLTSVATFGDASFEVPFYDVLVSYDEEQIRNDVQVIFNENGDTAFARDALSIARYGLKSYPLQASMQSGSTARNLAAFLVRLYSTPYVRVQGLVLKPRKNPTVIWPQALGRELGDRITIKFTPPGGGSRIIRDAFIRGITHEMTSKGEWETTFALQDATLFGGTFLKFNTSTFNGTHTFYF